ncbi:MULTISPECIES: DUF7224 domain-containing protein [unclassified Streptomyces]|uniref:DUF7224 domain-containing protein n=1 Tax=unclassified Streptomyces TaxID=2593676 RepID=UPI001F42559E|nr:MULTISPECIES: hypothetical protein [unclassified Streptomyces]
MLALPIKFNVLAGPPDQHLRPLPVAVRMLFALALATVAVTAPRLRTSAERQMPRRATSAYIRGVAIGSTAASFIALAALLPSGELRVERPASATSPVCDRAEEGAPQVCVWPEHRKYLPELTAMAQRLGRPVQPSLKAPEEFYEFGLRRTQWGDRGFDIAEGHVRTAAIAMADQVFTQSLGICIPPQNETRAWQAMDNIHLWLEYRSTGQDPAVADQGLHMEGVSAAQREATKATRMPAAEQQKWLAEERSHIVRGPSWCRPDDRF